jgi:hypothetical protein
MKLTFAVVAAVMSIAAPVFGQEAQDIKYHIKYVDSNDGTHNDLKDFNMQGDNKSAKYKNDSYQMPKFFIKESAPGNNFFKKAN